MFLLVPWGSSESSPRFRNPTTLADGDESAMHPNQCPRPSPGYSWSLRQRSPSRAGRRRRGRVATAFVWVSANWDNARRSFPRTGRLGWRGACERGSLSTRKLVVLEVRDRPGQGCYRVPAIPCSHDKMTVWGRYVPSYRRVCCAGNTGNGGKEENYACGSSHSPL